MYNKGENVKPISLKTARSEKNIFKCPDCHQRYYDSTMLYDHVEKDHAQNIPENNTTKQYVFNRKYKKTKGSCVICKKETKWNEELGRYDRYNDDQCREVARERFKTNARRKLGTDNPAATVEHQLKAIAGRNYSGKYTFKDGGEIGYSSSYELDFLKFIDEEMEFNSSEIDQCEIIFEFFFDGKNRFHIPDYYIPAHRLVIQIKDGGDNPNMNSNIQTTGRARQKLSDKAIIDSGCYNYVKIVNKDYSNFVSIIKLLKERSLSNNNDSKEVIICIPE